MTKYISTGIAVLALIVAMIAWVGDDNQSVVSVGGATRFPNSDITAKSLTLSSGNLAISSGNLSVVGSATVDEFTEGGGVQTETPSSGSHTLTEADMLSANYITFTASTTMPALTLTLPATSTMTTLLASAGDTRTWIIENPFTAAATTTTIAAGTGIDLQEPDGQNVVIGINNYAYVTCTRQASTDVMCKVDETIPAD